MIVFDNGAYSKDNARMIDEAGLGFVTRQQLNSTDDKFVHDNEDK